MNTDIRISLSFWDHPKTVKLERRLGLEGVKSLQIFWMWVAANRPDGDLKGTSDSLTNVERPLNDEDIEIAARWNGEENAFVKTLIDLGWLDKTDAGYVVHGWEEHNEWASKADERGDKARFSRLAKIDFVLFESLKKQGVTAITKKQYREMANDRLTNVGVNVNAPLTPSPSPSPSQKYKSIFTPPSINDVSNYCLERKNNVDPEKFTNHYTSNGWMVGKNKMKDWKAAVRTWEKSAPKPKGQIIGGLTFE